MDFATAANVPFEITLGGKPVRLAALSIGDLYGSLEQHVRGEAIADLRALCATIPDAAERQATMLAGWKDLPRGEAMQRKVEETLRSLTGLKLVLQLAARRAGAELTIADLDQRLTAADMEGLVPVISRLCGLEKKAEAPAP